MTMTLDEERERLRAECWDGTACGACGRWFEVHPRTLNVRGIIELMTIAKLHKQGHEWVHCSDFAQRNGDYAKMRLGDWALIEERPEEDGVATNGYWRLTPRGWAWLEGRLRIPLRILVLLNQDVGTLPDERRVSVEEVLSMGRREPDVRRAREIMKIFAEARI